MIVIGTRSIVSSRENGTFFCPSCGSLKPYIRKSERTFLTLYFLPIIPLKRKGEIIECQHCANYYPPQILSPDFPHETPFQERFQGTLKTIMLIVLAADNRISDPKIRQLQSIYLSMFNSQLTRQEILNEIETAQGQLEDVLSYLREINKTLNDTGKESIMKGAASVALSDGVLTDAEKNLLSRFRTALDMSEIHLKGVLADIGHNAEGAAFWPIVS